MKAKSILKIVWVFAVLYVFLVSIKLMGGSFTFFGAEFTKQLMATTADPIVALFIGMLATALIQSSSTTTSIIVAFVSGGVISLESAVPMVMGANIGTTVTNVLVSLAQINRLSEFKRGFAAAIVHDLFNWIVVFVFLPLELMTGFLRKSALALSGLLTGGADVSFHSPVKMIVEPAAKVVMAAVFRVGGDTIWTGILMLLVSFGLLFFALWQLVRTMKALAMGRTEVVFNKIVRKSPLVGIAGGAVLTSIIQSSSITTSIMVPLAGAGIVTLATVFPITLGANIGTTVTALLAAMAGNTDGLTIALVHGLFNVLGVLLIYPIKPLRNVPLKGAVWIAKFVSRRKIYAVLFVLVMFFALPGGIVLINWMISK